MTVMPTATMVFQGGGASHAAPRLILDASAAARDGFKLGSDQYFYIRHLSNNVNPGRFPMAFATFGPETNAGVTTSWLPLTTAGASLSDCFNTFWANSPIATTAPPTLTGLFVFSNPKNFPAPTVSAQCLPTEVTASLDVSIFDAIYVGNPLVNACPKAKQCQRHRTNQPRAHSMPFCLLCCAYSTAKHGGVDVLLSPVIYLHVSTHYLSWVSTTRTLQFPITLQGNLVEGFNLDVPTQAPFISPTGSTSSGSTGGSSSNSGPTSTSGSLSSSENTGVSNVPQQSSAAALPSKNLSSGTAIGISVGCSVLFLSVVGIVFFIWRHRRRRSWPRANPNPNPNPNPPPSQPAHHDDWRRIPSEEAVKTYRVYDLDNHRPPFELNNSDKESNISEVYMEKKIQYIPEIYGQELFELGSENGRGGR
ncbi:hypothetical protein B7494_g7103 [Chlorociboria aeruginascens]|nr:hypothetical protein B7494_g7103 [Chlorociboria aeruginascens]